MTDESQDRTVGVCHTHYSRHYRDAYFHCPEQNRNEILSVLGVAGRISYLPPTHTLFPVIKTRKTQKRKVIRSTTFTLVKLKVSLTVEK